MIKKMNPKQQVSGGLALEDWIRQADPSTDAQNMSVNVDPASISHIEMEKRVGRPPVPAAQAKTKTLQIKLTSAEHNALKEKAGRIPLSVYVRDMMKDEEII